MAEENIEKKVGREPDKKFKITHKGKTYDIAVFENETHDPMKLNLDVNIGKKSHNVDVELEAPIESEKAPSKGEPSAPSAPAAVPSAKPASPAIAPVQTSISGGKTLTAPMPGKILNVYVSEGDNVNSGETVIILEAMKMENELRAPGKARVAKLNVKEGDNVSTGDVLVEFE